MIDELLGRLKAGETLPGTSLESFAVDTFGSTTLGLVWDGLSLERVTAHLDVDARHLQPFGLVHGGVWCSVVESMASIGAALHALAVGHQVVGVNNSTDFVRAMREGRARGEAVPVHVGRSQQLWQVLITRETDGKLVARGQVRLQSLELPGSS